MFTNRHHLKVWLSALGMLALVLMGGGTRLASAAGAQTTEPTMWDLGDLYATPEAWNADYDKTKDGIDKLDSYKGTLGSSADVLFTALDAIFTLQKQSTRLYVYANLKGDEDLRIAANQERLQRAQQLMTQYGEHTAWLNPEIINLGADKVKSLEAQRKDLADRFGFYLTDTLRLAPHTLGLEAEGVLASAGDVLAQPQSISSQLSDADLPFPQFTLPDGQMIRLDEPAYVSYRQAIDRIERKAVFDGFWGTWKKYENTLGATQAAQVMGDVFTAKVRKYDSAMSAALFASNMPPEVYHTLVAQTHIALPTLYRYLRMRKARLGIQGDLAYYDNYPSLFPLTDAPQFTVQQSKDITLAALAPLGPEYLALLRKGFAGQWMNVLPHQGKATGAYMNGSAYDVHPYLLLNHTNDYNSLSTFAHEWGHAVHTLLTHESQPYEKSNYSTFIAESASIGNEMLLNDYMVAHAKNKAEKLFYLSEGLESIRTTYFRQVQFAEFELAMHEEIEKGQPLSGARLSDIYCGILKRYYGEDQGIMKIDPAYCIEWAFVTQFYEDFYVWQYATSMAGAAQLTDDILREGPSARARFITMLRAGGSNYPYELYKQAGIDMASPAPYQALAARMNRLMDQIEALEKQK